jgi:hypothetical protein
MTAVARRHEAAHRVAGRHATRERGGSVSSRAFRPGSIRPRILSIVESAKALYLETAEPRALVADISQEAFAGVYRGERRKCARDAR